MTRPRVRLRSPAMLLAACVVWSLLSCSGPGTPSTPTKPTTLTGTATAGSLVQQVTKITHYSYEIQVPGTTTVTLLDANNASLGTVTLSQNASTDTVAAYVGADGSTASIDVSVVSQGSGSSLTRRIYSSDSEQLELNIVSTSSGTIQQIELASPQGPASSPGMGPPPTRGFNNVLTVKGGAASVSGAQVQAWLKKSSPKLTGNRAANTLDAVVVDPSLFVALFGTIESGPPQSAPQNVGAGGLGRGVGQFSQAVTSAACSLGSVDSQDASDKWKPCKDAFLNAEAKAGSGVILEEAFAELFPPIELLVLADLLDVVEVADACEAWADVASKPLIDYWDCIDPGPSQNPNPPNTTTTTSSTGTAGTSTSGTSATGSSSSSSTTSSGSGGAGGAGGDGCNQQAPNLLVCSWVAGNASTCAELGAGWIPGSCPHSETNALGTGQLVGCCVNASQAATCYYPTPKQPLSGPAGTCNPGLTWQTTAP